MTAAVDDLEPVLAPGLRAPFPYPGADALAVVLALVRAGALRVDPDGSVWRVGARTKTGLRSVEPRRAENPAGRGYLRVTVGLPDGTTGCVMAHRVVWTVLRGPIPAGLQINHRDLDKRNNDPRNLELATQPENIRHALANGCARSWSKRGRTGDWRPGKPVLSDEQVAALRAQRRDGATFKEIAGRFGIAISHAHRLCVKGAP